MRMPILVQCETQTPKCYVYITPSSLPIHPLIPLAMNLDLPAPPTHYELYYIHDKLQQTKKKQ